MGNILLRALYLVFAYIVGVLFLGSATHKLGGAHLDIFIIPTLVSLIVIYYAIRIGEAKYIPLLAFSCVLFGLVTIPGEFWHTNIMGTGMMILFFNALRKW